MKTRFLLFVCCLVSLFAVSAWGLMPPPPDPLGPPNGYADQYRFTGPAKIVTVAQAKTFEHHTPVIVTGNLVQALGGDLYLFRDASGDITMRIGPREWYAYGANISPSEKIEVSGEVHWPRHYGSGQSVPEIHARSIRKV